MACRLKKAFSLRWPVSREPVVAELIPTRCPGPARRRTCPAHGEPNDSDFWQSPETLDTVRKITPDALFFDVKNSCLTLAVSPEKVERVVKSLHNSLIS